MVPDELSIYKNNIRKVWISKKQMIIWLFTIEVFLKDATNKPIHVPV